MLTSTSLTVVLGATGKTGSRVANRLRRMAADWAVDQAR